MKPKPYLIDSTLRDGEQAPGVVFHLDEKMKIASLLDQARVPEVEVGTPAMGKQEVTEIKAIVQAGFKFKTLSWCRATKEDIDAAAQTGTSGVNISFPVSDIHLLAMGKTQAWVLGSMREMVAYASDRFDYVAIGAQDASRAEFHFLSDFLGEAIFLKASRVRIADTVGILNPITTARLFRKIRKYFPHLCLEFHGHNDLGMATANTFTALSTGANCASVTVNGIGERAGNAALEEIVMALELSSSLFHGINTAVLGELSHLVSQSSGIQLPVNKPITGGKALSHESGIHTNILLKNRDTYQIVKASRIGLYEQDFVFGKHCGKSALISFLNQNNITLECSGYMTILEQIKINASYLKRALTRQEVLSLVVSEKI
jgi:homocitrate synthase NifV